MGNDKATISHQTAIATVVANNPSPMTGAGTNSYVLRNQGCAIVIDPGPDDLAHLDALITSIGDHTLAAILVTHPHLDHSALAGRLSGVTSAPIMAFGNANAGRHPTVEKLIRSGMTIAGEGADHTFSPDMTLKDGDEIVIGQDTLRVLHTPGHMGSHICFALGPVLFSGDHVMGWAPSLIAPPDGHMGDYMASLQRLKQREWALILPGHGDAMVKPSQRLEALWLHRKSREQSILLQLAACPSSPHTLTQSLYAATNPALWPAAERSVMSHLIDLHERSKVFTDTGFTSHSLFQLI